jgi:hypothetical protein
MQLGLGRPGLINADDGTDPSALWAGIATQIPTGTPNAPAVSEPSIAPPATDYTKYILIGAAVLVALVLVRR